MPTVSPLMRPAFPYADGFPSYAHLASSYANLAFSFPYAVCSLPPAPPPPLPPAPPAPSLRLTLSCPTLSCAGHERKQAIGEAPCTGSPFAASYWGNPFEWRSLIHYRVFLCSKLLGKSRLYSLLVQQAIGEVPFVGCLLQQAIGEVHFWCLLLPLENQP